MPPCSPVPISLHALKDDTSFHSAIHYLKDYFFDCLESESMIDFERDWKIFAQALDLNQDKLQQETLELVNAVAHTVETVSSSLLELDTLTQDIEAELKNDVERFTKEPSVQLKRLQSESTHTYIRTAHTWLLDHLHNPYPSVVTRDQIARSSSIPRKAVDTWFAEARKAIGWNELCKTFFSNKRAAIVEAASHVFPRRDPSHTLCADLVSRFATIQYNAINLDLGLKDSKTPLRRSANPSLSQMTSRTQYSTKPSHWYPSPESSPTQSPRSTQMDEYLGPWDTFTAPQDISFSASTRDRGVLDLGLPSPAPSMEEVDIEIHTNSTGKRKRRLSDASTNRVPKRQKGVPAGPRLHAVSDPLPTSQHLFDPTYFNGWFNNAGPIVPVASTSNLEPPVDVQLFDYTTLAEQLLDDSAGSFLLSNDVPSLPGPPDCLAPLFELETVSFDGDWFQFSFDNLEDVTCYPSPQDSYTHFDSSIDPGPNSPISPPPFETLDLCPPMLYSSAVESLDFIITSQPFLTT